MGFVISVASGKGGTGKTTIATSLALSLEEVQFLDCDVEEPNSNIFLNTDFSEKKEISVPIPKIDYSKCNFCKKCAKVCEYNAIAVLKDTVLVFENLCHGCGACTMLCPEGAISEIPLKIGILESGYSNKIKFAHGKINIGYAMPGPMIRAVKKSADRGKTVIIDAPPGTSCPMVLSVKGSNFCILVTEPTPFGLNDLSLAVEVLRKLKIPFGVVLNLADMGDKKVEDYCKKEKIEILMKIPFKKEIAVGYSKGIPLVKVFPEYKEKFKKIYEKINKKNEYIKIKPSF